TALCNRNLSRCPGSRDRLVPGSSSTRLAPAGILLGTSGSRAVSPPSSDGRLNSFAAGSSSSQLWRGAPFFPGGGFFLSLVIPRSLRSLLRAVEDPGLFVLPGFGEFRGVFEFPLRQATCRRKGLLQHPPTECLGAVGGGG